LRGSKPFPLIPPALTVEGVGYSYGLRRVLSGVDLSLPRGVVTILLGPNGAGKSTLLSLIVSLLALQDGEIRVNGVPIRADRASSLAPVGIVFQQPTLDLDLSVRRNLAYFAGLRGLAPALARARIAEELDRFDLADRAGDAVRNLNGGHRRRVEIARATLHEPEILILDEPTVGLDIPSRAALVEDLHRRAAEGMAVFWATHLIDEVWPQDRIVVLHRGEVRAAGTVAEVVAAAGAADLGGAFAALTAEEKAA
jgi:ABC-2 type transport system ATP-binding protein